MRDLLQEYIETVILAFHLLEISEVRYTQFSDGASFYMPELSVSLNTLVNEISVMVECKNEIARKIFKDEQITKIEGFNRLEDYFSHKGYVFKFSDFEKFKYFFNKYVLG